ncbi:MAG TPA: hypothetical protein VMW56_28905 [Candidatus Margulisiibacteriota bacterium]|nr:hypothetical protein [Candidatus Margulisiibacteriota bacterium]
MSGDKRQQGVEVHGLGNVGNCLELRCDPRRIRTARVENHGNCGKPWVCQLLATKVYAVFQGHLDVEENETGHEPFAQTAESFLAVPGRDDRVASQLEQLANRAADDGIIVHN